MTREIKILCGVSGCGKSTWAEQEAQRLSWDGWHPVIVSRDDVRFRFLDDNNSNDYFAFEDDVFKEFVREINECAENNFDYIIVDATHISHGSRMKLLRRLRLDARTDVTFEVFNYPLEVCLYRNSWRKGRERVPASVIKSMKAGFTVPDIEKTKEELGWKNKFTVNMHYWGDK